ncbi:MAG: ExbD/TolR family protein [Campylobacterota bacterium]
MFNWDETPDLNITPLVDVMLVLMAILMITAPTVLYQEDINLPQGSQSQSVSQDKSVEINLHKDGYIIFNKEKIPYKEFEDSFILESSSLDKETTVYINADEQLQYKNVMHILKVVKQAGFSKASLVTHE